MKKYEDLTADQKAMICNGCGAKGSFIRPPYGSFFLASCNHHDYGYWKGCTEDHRKICDKNFLTAMLKDCSTLPWYNKIRYYPWCHAYYRAVRIFGKKAFYYAETQRDIDIIKKD